MATAADTDVAKSDVKSAGVTGRGRQRTDSKTSQTHRTSGTQDSLASAFIWPVWQSGYKQRATDRRNSRPESQSRTALWVLMQTVPTPDCDVLLTLPTNDDTLHWIVSCLHNRLPALAVTVRYHSNTQVHGLYLTAEFDDLLLGAEKLRLKKPVSPDYGGGRREFTWNDRDCFQNIDDPSAFFCSEERASIVKHMLFGLRSQKGEQVADVTFHEGQAIVPLLLSKGLIQQLLPIHCPDECHRLYANWVLAIFSGQPLDEVRAYFGVKIALYFAYLGHYTSALVAPTIIGILSFYLSSYGQVASDACFVGFALLNVLWAVMYLEHWKRRSAEYSHRWGTLDIPDDLLMEPRPLFHGTLETSPVTGQPELTYSSRKRNLFFYLVSYPVMLLCLSAVFATLWACFEVQDWVNERCSKDHWYHVYTYLPKVLLAICIACLGNVYKKIAIWLNDKENHRLQESYENHLIFKLVLFQFVNSFLSLFYIAFYLQDMERLRAQLAALLVTRQVMGNLTETVLPYILTKVMLFRISKRFVEQKFLHSRISSLGSQKEPVLHEDIRKDVAQDTQLESVRRIELPEEQSLTSESCALEPKTATPQSEDGGLADKTVPEDSAAKKSDHEDTGGGHRTDSREHHRHKSHKHSSQHVSHGSSHHHHRDEEGGLRHRKHSTLTNIDSETKGSSNDTSSGYCHRRHEDEDSSHHIHLHRRQHSRTNLNDSSDHVNKHRHGSHMRDDDLFLVPGQSGGGLHIIRDDMRYVDPIDLFGYIPQTISARDHSSTSKSIGKWFGQRNNSANDDDDVEERDENNHCYRKRTSKKQASLVAERKIEREIERQKALQKEKDVKRDPVSRAARNETSEEATDKKVTPESSKRISFGSKPPSTKEERLSSSVLDYDERLTYVTDESTILTQAELEGAMPKYEGTFDDYLEMFIQFGYVILFSSAFPLAALCALINNIIEIRSDAFKLCTTFQRPFGEGAASIGTWQSALQLMSLIAILVNCALIGQSDLADRLFPNVSAVHRVIYIVILEHLILAMKVLMSYAIPNVPEWIHIENARLEMHRRHALRVIESKELYIPYRQSVSSERGSLKIYPI